VQLTDIFAGAMPFLLLVFLSMFIVYMFPGIALWLPEYMYR
jgi:TRAP-type mannitol/chloroaromatic compound transport system permease large subunit